MSSKQSVSKSPPNEWQTERAIFDKLCEQYGVPKNEKGTGLQIRNENGTVEPLTVKKLKEILPNEESTITIKVTMKNRWMETFCAFLKRMQYNGNAGTSEMLHFYSDGDGDFRPKIEFVNLSPEFNIFPPSDIFDAG